MCNTKVGHNNCRQYCGIAYSLTSSHSISLGFLEYVAMNTERTVANGNTLCQWTGDKHNANNGTTVTAVSPVLPPSLIPAPLSI